MIFFVATVQMLPVPQGVINMFSPNVLLYAEALIPEQREMVLGAPDDREGSATAVSRSARWAVGNKLSLNPGGSYSFAIRILALAAIFLAVTSLVDPGKVLLRLSIASAVVGSAFALFGIAQYFSVNKNQLYWFFETNGNGFAAFRNRNHYPFFANMTLGLSIGLLLDRFSRSKRSLASWLVNDIWSLWIAAAIVFIGASIFLCASRGGFVGMVVALTIGMLPQLNPEHRLKALAGSTGLVVCTALLLSWLGFDLFNSRLSTLADSTEMREESRWHLWTAAWDGIRQFPIVGAGGDTFRYWETIFHQNEAWNSAIHQGTRADNEYLDVFLEFGILGFVSLVVMAAVVLRRGYLLSRHSGLATGAFIAMLAVIVHSGLDFGLRVPACAVLATMIAALICNLPGWSRHEAGGQRSASSTKPASVTVTYATRGNAVAFAVVCCLVGTLIVQDKLRQATAFNLQALGMRALAVDDLQSCAELMIQSTEVLPEDVNNQVRAVQIILRSLDATAETVERQARTAQAIGLAIKARDLCPLAFEPHVWLAEGYAQIKTSRAKVDYLAVAHRLHPSSAQISFQLGAELMAAGRFDEAWPAWRESIRFNPFRMEYILAQASQRLSPEEIVQLVLPPNARSVFSAATLADRNGDHAAEKVYLTRVLELLPMDDPALARDSQEFAKRWELVARSNVRLDNIEAAIAAYKNAISYKPDAAEWRLTLVQLLIKQANYDQAAREVRTALVFEPDNETLKALQNRISRLKRESERSKSRE